MTQTVYVVLPSRNSTSCKVGIDGAVPGLVTEMPATAQAKRTASNGEMPRARRGGETAIEGIAAPVGSATTPARKAATCSDRRRE